MEILYMEIWSKWFRFWNKLKNYVYFVELFNVNKFQNKANGKDVKSILMIKLT